MTVTASGVVSTPTMAERISNVEKRLQLVEERAGEADASQKAEVQALRNELNLIRTSIEEVKRETVQLDASALPIIVLGVVLGGIAPDAEEFQLWFWWLILASSVAFTAWRTFVIFRDWRAASRVDPVA